MVDDDVLDIADFENPEEKLSDEQKEKVDEFEERFKHIKQPYFCANSTLIFQLYNKKLNDGEAFNTKEGLMVMCVNAIKEGSFFTNLDISKEDLLG